jgi:hypothetical protein
LTKIIIALLLTMLLTMSRSRSKKWTKIMHTHAVDYSALKHQYE